MRCLVVWAFEVIIDKRSPTKAFMSVDLPTLGFPMMLTNPALWVIFVFLTLCRLAPRLCGCKYTADIVAFAFFGKVIEPTKADTKKPLMTEA
jgi:hypothetical protein